MSRNLLISGVLSILLVIGIYSSYQRWFQLDVRLYHYLLEQIQELRVSDALLDKSILELRTGISLNYDHVNNSATAMRSISTSIDLTVESLPELSESVTKAIDGIGELNNARFVDLERYKSQHAIYRNSTIFVQTQLVEVVQEIDDKSIVAAIVEVSDFLRDPLLQHKQRKTDRVSSEIDILSEYADANSDNHVLISIVRHMRLLQMRGDDISSTMTSLMSSGVTGSIDALLKLYHTELINVQDRVKAANIILSVVAITLLFMIAFAVSRIFRDRKSLLNLTQSLENRVKERTADLELAMIEAESASESKSQFLASMSHELRTPLNSIIGFGKMLELNHEEPLSPDQKIAVGHIKNGGAHLLSLVDEVLDLSKIEARELELSVEHVHPAHVFGDCLELVRGLADSKNVSLGALMESDNCVLADYGRLKQVLLNLLSNAVKYNRDGGSVNFGCEALSDDTVRISVSDSGNGIPNENLSEMFTPFNRLGMEASQIEGTGIGLTISKRLIEEMGGRIGCESEVGIGSTFWLELPRSHGNALAQPVATRETQHRVNPLLQSGSVTGDILYVEDNPANRDLMKMILGRMGNLTLHIAHTAEIGIVMAEEVHPDLILMDINLPGMSGTKALSVLRQNENTKDIPVVAASANALPHDIRTAMESGFDGYITKPFDIPVMITTISNLLEGVDVDKGQSVSVANNSSRSTRVALDYAPLGELDIGRILSAVQMLPPSYRAILENQANSIPVILRELQHVSSTQDFKAVETLAHKLKTNSGTFGARQIWSLAQEVENFARDEALEEIPRLLDDMEKEYDIVAPVIARLMADLEADANALNSE